MNKLKATSKITMATVKAFINRNREHLYIKNISTWDGQIDGTRSCDNVFRKAIPSDRNSDRSLGIEGAWFVGGSRDYFTPFEEGDFVGVEVYNSCGSFVIAIKNYK